MGGRLTYLLVIAMTWAGLVFTATPLAHADTPFTLDLRLDLRDDGTLRVTQTTTVPGGATVTSQIPLQIAVEGNRTQHYAISDISAENGAHATIDGDNLSLSAPAGTATVRYTVAGTVGDGPDLQQFTWLLAAAWSQPITTLKGTFSSPSASVDSPICAYGQIGVRRLCSLTQTELGGQVRFQHNNLAAGDVVVFSVLLPAETVPATAQFTPTVTADDHDGTAPHSQAGVITILIASVLALAAVAAAWWRRRADTIAATSGTDQPDMFTPSGGEGFSSPDGVLPGQIGTVISGAARPSDIGATVLDLAVRNYLWLAETPRDGADPDFQISRRADLDAAVSTYERAVVEALLPGGRQSIMLSELTANPAPVQLTAVTSGIDSSLRERGWVRRPDTLVRAGLALFGVGAAAVAVLAVVGVSPLFGAALASIHRLTSVTGVVSR